jgi:hypothetical protein
MRYKMAMQVAAEARQVSLAGVAQRGVAERGHRLAKAAAGVESDRMEYWPLRADVGRAEAWRSAAA